MPRRAKRNVVKLLLKVGTFLQREGDRIAGLSGLTQQQFVVLKEIEERGPVNHKEICSELLLEKSNVSKIVKKLAKERLVTIHPLPADHRVMMLDISPKGRRVVRLCMGRFNAWNDEWLEALSPEEMARAERALVLINGLQG